MFKFTCNAPDVVMAALGRKPGEKGKSKPDQTFIMFDTPSELGNYAKSKNFHGRNERAGGWYGNEDANDCVKFCATGDLRNVEKSDKYLAKYEEMDLATMRPQWHDEVVGERPNIQAHIAGHPLAMRRRSREDNAMAPLAIIVDLTTSAALSTEQIMKRGACVLALVRILSARRPVELWAGTVLDAYLNNWVTVMCKVEAAPLDLAVAAHVLTGAGFPRRLCYGISNECEYRGHWGFDNEDVSRKYMKPLFEPAFPHVVDMLCIPGLHLDNPLVTNPEKWLDETVKKYAPHLLGID